MSDIVKPGDRVETPLHRTALVLGVLPRHLRICQYEDDGEVVELRRDLLTVIESAPVRRWSDRSIPV